MRHQLLGPVRRSSGHSSTSRVVVFLARVRCGLSWRWASRLRFSTIATFWSERIFSDVVLASLVVFFVTVTLWRYIEPRADVIDAECDERARARGG